MNTGSGTKRLSVLAALAVCVFSPLSVSQVKKSEVEQRHTKQGETDWPSYLGSPANTHYSKLAQINVSNVSQLKEVWRYDTQEKGGLETTPLMIDGVLFAYTPEQKVIALNAATGALLWTFDSQKEFAAEKVTSRAERGLAYWRQYPPRCRQHRLLPRAWRGEDPDHRPRICRCHRAGAAPDRPKHHRDRYRRSPGRGRGTAAGRDGLRGLHRRGDPGYRAEAPADEWAPISLGYTSGTTGNPKGVVCHHRGAYLNALSVAMTAGLTRQSSYLWTLPMFHCNGWCFTWAVTAVAGTHICMRRMDPALVYATIKREGVTHLCGAPVVLNMLANAPEFRQAAVRSEGFGHHRRCGAAQRHHRRDGAQRLQCHACLWAHRMLRPGAELRLARRMGRAWAWRSGPG